MLEGLPFPEQKRGLDNRCASDPAHATGYSRAKDRALGAEDRKRRATIDEIQTLQPVHAARASTRRAEAVSEDGDPNAGVTLVQVRLGGVDFWVSPLLLTDIHTGQDYDRAWTPKE